MSRKINVSIEAMGQSIAEIGSLRNDLNDALNNFTSRVNGLSGRAWNEETGANINSNLELASNDIKNIIGQLEDFDVEVENNE